METQTSHPEHAVSRALLEKKAHKLGPILLSDFRLRGQSTETVQAELIDPRELEKQSRAENRLPLAILRASLLENREEIIPLINKMLHAVIVKEQMSQDQQEDTFDPELSAKIMEIGNDFIEYAQRNGVPLDTTPDDVVVQFHPRSA